MLNRKGAKDAKRTQRSDFANEALLFFFVFLLCVHFANFAPLRIENFSRGAGGL